MNEIKNKNEKWKLYDERLIEEMFGVFTCNRSLQRKLKSHMTYCRKHCSPSTPTPAAVLYLLAFVCGCSTELEQPGSDTDHAEVTALKETAPRPLQGQHSQLVLLHRHSHADDYPLGGHCALPRPRQSVTVAAGHTRVIQGSAALISSLQWRCWCGEGCFWDSLWL